MSRTSVIVLVVFALIINLAFSLESKVVIDDFTAVQQNNVNYPGDCNFGDFIVDNSVLGNGRLISFGEEIIANNYFVVCDNDSSCSLSSSIGNGSWLIEASNNVSGDCQITSTYSGNYIDYSINGGEGFRLTSDGASSFRIVASVLNAPVHIFVFTERTELGAVQLSVGNNQEVVLDFPEFDDPYQYFDFVSEITLGVRFTSSASIEIHSFETYGPENSQNPIPIPSPFPTNGVQTIYTFDSFTTIFSESGSIQPEFECGGVSDSSNSNTDVVGSRSVSFSACSDSGADFSISQSNGELITSLSLGVTGHIAFQYRSFNTELDFCEGDGVLLRYSSADEVECLVYVISDDDDGVCEVSVLFDPTDEVRVLLLDDFNMKNCDISRLSSASIQCDLYGNSQEMIWKSFEYICSDGSCSCGQDSSSTQDISSSTIDNISSSTQSTDSSSSFFSFSDLSSSNSDDSSSNTTKISILTIFVFVFLLF